MGKKMILLKGASLGLSALGLLINFIANIVSDKKEDLSIDEKVSEKVTEAFAKMNEESES